MAMSIMVAWQFLKQYRLRARMVTRIQQRFPPLAFTHQDFPWLPESFHDIMNCGWWKTYIICNLPLRNIVSILTILSRSLAQCGEPRPNLACKN